MVNFIARMIEKAANISVEAGQTKYEAYFVNTNIYEKYREAVNTILISAGFEDVIIEA